MLYQIQKDTKFGLTVWVLLAGGSIIHSYLSYNACKSKMDELLNKQRRLKSFNNIV
jgi:hypothetical protein